MARHVRRGALVRDVLPHAWSVVLALLMLGPALGRGFVLTYDMVWVPDLVLRADFLGLASGLPRAVPSDAVVAVLDEAVPGELLQKLVLLAALVGAGTGAAHLLAGLPLSGRLVAVSVYQWNPLVVERLLIGHWPVLLGYAALPWIVVAARTWRRTGRLPVVLCVLLPVASLSASAGVAAGVVLVLVAATRRPGHLVRVVALAAAANAPWFVAGLLHAANATTAGSGAEAFALADEGSVPAPVAALTLGGIWNSEVVPDARAGLLGWVATVALLVLAAAGARRWWRTSERRDAVALVVMWGLGFVLAVSTWAAPDAAGWLFSTVPGAGLFRDGARVLVLCAPLLVVLVAHGTEPALRVLAPEPGSRVVFAPVLVVLPVVLLPGALLGAGGRLGAVSFPESYEAARAVTGPGAADGAGDLVSLPLSSYRQPSWNEDRKVLDPVWRYLPRNYVASDELVVGGTTLPGEDPRVADVRRALAQETPEERATALAGEGIGVVVTDTTAVGDAPEVAGRVLLDGDLRVVALDEPADPVRRTTWDVGMGAAWAAFLGCLATGLVLVAARRRGPRTPTVENPGRDGARCYGEPPTRRASRGNQQHCDSDRDDGRGRRRGRGRDRGTRQQPDGRA
ncbi:hypothetical protein FE634_21680 [Nocardioides dongxiaopingii]|uniref:hypothetical protein n=1 Tax=Nocardioides sp. S-1144 TaxID=2582905 RepID=UPI0011628083|nr:hypothetical protein [Nocardioides sp. S-1144]QDH10839.1 hypothetical protein FE634_21680 [Nocardioides sp. S-1144]